LLALRFSRRRYFEFIDAPSFTPKFLSLELLKGAAAPEAGCGLLLFVAEGREAY
jgi:hypothetical protein